MRFELVVAGVGGQGVVMAARLVAEAAMADGHAVYMGEVHGMAQRGGSVLCMVRMGDVWGPLIRPGEADALLALELAEALRYRELVAPDGVVVTSTRRIPPITVATGEATYPPSDAILASLERTAGCVIALDAHSLAVEAGTDRAENMVLVGALAGSGRMPVPADRFLEASTRLLPPRALGANRRAFELGLSAATAARAASAPAPPGTVGETSGAPTQAPV